MREDVARAVGVLKGGGLVALPTETVYGLGADASNELAVRRIFAVKGRPSTHPLIVHVADAQAAARTWASEFPAAAAGAWRSAFWPGPLTLIVKRSAQASDAVTGGQDTVGLRVPGHPLALELLTRARRRRRGAERQPLRRVSPTTAAHVREELGDEVDLVLDGGPCRWAWSPPSSTCRAARRRGCCGPAAWRRRRWRPCSACRSRWSREATDVRAPGLLASHYAPKAGGPGGGGGGRSRREASRSGSAGA